MSKTVSKFYCIFKQYFQGNFIILAYYQSMHLSSHLYLSIFFLSLTQHLQRSYTSGDVEGISQVTPHSLHFHSHCCADPPHPWPFSNIYPHPDADHGRDFGPSHFLLVIKFPNDNKASLQ